MQRRRFKELAPLDQRLEEQAKRLRKEAQGTPPGVSGISSLGKPGRRRLRPICRNGSCRPACNRRGDRE
jgi:hypothetical protein